MYKKIANIILLSYFISLGLFVPAYADAAAPLKDAGTLAVVLFLGAAVTIIWVVACFAIRYFKRKNDKKQKRG